MSSASQHHWLIYALGGGLGHVTRATAFARAANRAGVTCTLVANSALLPLVPIVRELRAGSRLVALDSQLEPALVAARLRQLFSELKPTRFIVDTFPRGLGGEFVLRENSVDSTFEQQQRELDELHRDSPAPTPALSLLEVVAKQHCPMVLLHRDLNPQYIAKYGLNEFVAEHFDLVVVPGEKPTLNVTSRFFSTSPFFIRDVDELLPASVAREFLSNAASDEAKLPLVLVIATGQAHEITEMHNIAAELAVRCRTDAVIRLVSLIEPKHELARRLWLREWPVLPMLPGVDLLIGAGGYNSVHEARAVNVPFVGFARQRLYDRQANRLGVTEVSERLDEMGLDELVCRIRSTRQRATTTQLNFENGAHAAVRSVLELKPRAT